MVCVSNCLAGWQACCQAGWLAGWLVGWLAGWLAGWLVGWLGPPPRESGGLSPPSPPWGTIGIFGSQIGPELVSEALVVIFVIYAKMMQNGP